ncbi:MAG: hypothetical protein ACSHXF_12700 [Aquaticitalea sp.]
MFKKILFTFISIVLAYNAYKLVFYFFIRTPDEFSTVGTIFSAIAFNLFITGTVAFLGFVYPTSKLIPNSYYQIKQPKKLNTWYKSLGVEYFRFFLLKTFYRNDNNKKYFNGSKSGIIAFDYNTKQSEFGHLIAFCMICLVSIILLLKGHINTFIWIQPINILFNFYPIILQRKHRIIVERLINRII